MLDRALHRADEVVFEPIRTQARRYEDGKDSLLLALLRDAARLPSPEGLRET